MPTITITSPAAIEMPTPVTLVPRGDAIPDGNLLLIPEAGGDPLPAQRQGDTTVVAVFHQLPANTTLRYRLESTTETLPGVSVHEGEDTLELRLPEGPFGTYHYGPQVARPYVWPLFGPGGKRVTRNFPMEQREDEKHDHPHHKSLWTAYGDVNGVENWHEQKGHGYMRHQEFVELEQGPVFAGFTARNLWTDPEGNPALSELRSLRLYNVGEAQRLLNYTVVLHADRGDVVFGDTKEAGILSVRVATTMDGARGGAIENGDGGRTEAECWGKPSTWCDYSGPVEGETLESETLGIAVLDHPDNPGHPPRWHVRDYGLMGSNPFSTGAFTGGDPTPVTLRQGERFTFRYRVLLHRGDAAAGQVAAFYDAFARPPVLSSAE